MANRTMLRPLAVLAVLAAGCAARSTNARALYPGDPSAAPSMEVLPEPDVPIDDMTEKMRFAWLLAEQSFELPDPPPPPASPALAQLRRWTDGQLEPWLEKKNELVEAARAELDAAAEQRHRQRIIAGALVGLMYEDVARVLLEVPIPTDLEGEPEIRDMYRDIVSHQARPYVAHARRAYRACAANAVRPAGMRPWSRFCAARLDGLPGADTLAPGETQVTVTVE